MCSATDYVMALAASQKQTLQNKGDRKNGGMKNGAIRHLIIEQSGVFVASEEHTDDDKDIFLPKLRIPLQISDCCQTLLKGSQKFLESKILSDHNDRELSFLRC